MTGRFDAPMTGGLKMKIPNQQLKQIIKEELESAISEWNGGPHDFDPRDKPKLSPDPYGLRGPDLRAKPCKDLERMYKERYNELPGNPLPQHDKKLHAIYKKMELDQPMDLRRQKCTDYFLRTLHKGFPADK